MDYGPAWVFGERWDIVAWNRAASVIHGDLASLQGIERNALYQLFLGDRMRSILVDWEKHGRQCVAKLRATYASRVDDPWFNELVTLLRTRSDQFERWWNENDIEAFQEGVKHYEHPEAGRLVFDYSVLEVLDERMSSLRLGGLRAGAGHRDAGEDGEAARGHGADAARLAGVGLTTTVMKPIPETTTLLAAAAAERRRPAPVDG